jgi:hypothetical protein
MSNVPDYTAFKEQPQAEDLKTLSTLVSELVKAMVELDDLETRAAEAKKRVLKLSDLDIPEVMKRAGTQLYGTPDGWKVELVDFVSATIRKEKKAEGLDWLDKNGHGGLIKRSITVAFNRDEGEEAQKLLRELEPRFEALAMESKVEPSTFTAFVKEQLKDGIDLPEELFSVFQAERAKVTPPKKRG